MRWRTSLTSDSSVERWHHVAAEGSSVSRVACVPTETERSIQRQRLKACGGVQPTRNRQ